MINSGLRSFVPKGAPLRALGIALALLFGTDLDATAQTGVKKPFRVVWASPSLSMFDSTLTFAVDHGYLKEEGIEVERIVTGSGNNWPALLSNQAQITTANLIDVMTLRAKGQALKGFAVTSATIGFDFSINAASAKKIGYDVKWPVEKKVQALKTLVLQTQSPAAGNTKVAQFLASRYGVDPNKELKLTFLADGMSVMAAMKNGQIDVMGMGPPFSEQLELSGEAIRFLDFTGGEVKELNGVIQGMVIAKESWLKENPEVANRIYTAVRKATEFMLNPANDPVVIPVLAKSMSQSDESVRLSLAAYRRGPYKAGAQMSPEQFETTANFARAVATPESEKITATYSDVWYDASK